MIRTSAILGLLSAAIFSLSADVCAQQAGDPRVRVVTSAGDFVIRLDAGRAPMTVDAFLEKVDEGFYEGTIFHRVVAGFVAQGGGFTADMELKPTDSWVVNESGNGLSNLRGTVGLARSNEPHTGTTQFYVNLADNLDLNPRPSRWGYAVFGTIEEGMEVVDSIGHSATAGGGEFVRNVPVTPIVIERIERVSE
ncbi:MAG TPA: peptidylprolyl isomerase [Gammaproteobacteria bacterium]|nr:peptidylprolyl isomerase [Gammaproteobacteria bacterium]